MKQWSTCRMKRLVKGRNDQKVNIRVSSYFNVSFQLLCDFLVQPIMMFINIIQVLADEAQDEMAPYFNRETTPKILITTTDRPSLVSFIYLSYHNMCMMHSLLICEVKMSTDTVIIINNFIHCNFTVA